MCRVGTSLPIGPAMTPQASSGWSRRAWATIAAMIARSMVSTAFTLPWHFAARLVAVPTHVPLINLRERVEQRLLEIAEVRVHRELEDPAGTGILQHRVVQLLAQVGVRLDLQAGAHREPGVVDRPQPRLGGLAVEAHLALPLVG